MNYEQQHLDKMANERRMAPQQPIMPKNAPVTNYESLSYSKTLPMDHMNAKNP